MAAVKIAKVPSWAELLGSNEWKGLLEPLELSLRRLILRCGDLCEATYDAFNSDEDSKYCGHNRYGKKSFFKKICPPPEICPSDYQVVEFLYATASSDDVSKAPTFIIKPKYSSSSDVECESNWIGYIAVTTDEVSKANGRREVYVVWRGTVRPLELQVDLRTKLVPATPLMATASNDGANVMEGWLKIYTSSIPDSKFSRISAQTQVLNKIRQLMKEYKDEKLSLIFTGHSLGGALAALSAFNVVEKLGVGNESNDHVKVAAFVFSCPMLGNKVFCDKLKAALPILHVKNGKDQVPNLPGLFFKGYAYAGIDLPVDSTKSPYLKTSLSKDSLWDWHNLEGLLHVVAGWNGWDGEFDQRKVNRCWALVNKSCNFLKEEFQIPPSWWVEKNKGMVHYENGDWLEDNPFEED